MTADDIIGAYIECALWSSPDNADDTGGEPLDTNYGPDDLAPETLDTMRAECADFLFHCSRLGIAFDGLDASQVGHDFWLTRNRHGAGFWDRGLGVLGDRLTDAAHSFGESYLHIGDDGRIYVS